MCLVITATFDEGVHLSHDTARQISLQSGLHVSAGNGLFSRTLRLSEERGCACSMLAEDADWNAETWSFRAEVLEPLALAVGMLADFGSLTFQAQWLNRKPTSEVAGTLEALLDDIRRNGIRSTAAYRIMSHARAYGDRR